MAAPFAEFAGNKRLLWIAHEWEERADDLARWAMERLVNRRDVWSQYTLRGDKIGVVMLPIPERRAARHRYGDDAKIAAAFFRALAFAPDRAARHQRP